MPREDILRELSVEKAWSHLEHITEQIPSRLAGSANARQMAEYSYEACREAGLDARLHEFLGLVSFPEEGRVWLLSPEAREIPGHTLGHSASTDGLEGELVYVGSGAESEYEGKDVRGKITLSELSYSPGRHEKAYIAWKRGSTAQIMMNWGDATNQAIPFGSMKSAWGNPTPETLQTEIPDLPCVGIARVEGLQLKALCAQGLVRVRLQARAENTWKPLTLTTAEFGTARDRQFVLLGGHQDSWFGPQASDNAAGNACMMELSRVFGRHRDELRRGLVTGFWVGHETGTMVSSSRFVDLNWDWLRKYCVAYLQIDQPALVGTSTWRLHSTDDIQAYAVQATKGTARDLPIIWERQQKNGDTSFFGVGIPTLSGEMGFTDKELEATALAICGWYHHSIHNSIDKIDRALMADHLHAYADWLWGLLTEPVLPYAYLPIATRFVERLSEFARIDIPEIDIKGGVECAKEFQHLAAQLDERAEVWRRKDAGSEVDQGAEVLNQAMIQLSRILNPIASTKAGTYGQDRYGHAWQTQMIPSLVPYPKLARYPRDSEEFQTWWVEMIRARNRVVDALDAASEVARRVLRELP